MVDEERVRRRIRAARELVGMSREELGAKLHEDGFGLHDVAALEREVSDGAKARRVPLTRGRRESLAHHLGVPEEWFTVEDPRTLIRPAEGESDGPRVVEIATLAEIRGALEEIRTLLVRDDRRAGESGG